jgi:hypothetical protein
MDAIGFECNACNFTTDRKFNYQQHLETQKHKENTEYKCNNCGNYYKQDSSLYRHKRNCTIQKSDNSERPIDDITNIITTVVETNNQFQTKMIEENKNMMGNFVEKFVETFTESFVESNAQFQNKMIESNKSTIETVINACVTIGKNRAEKKEKFNLDNYLNNTCKNAMNIEEFVDKIDPTYDDVVCVGQHGYVEGNAEVIIKYLNSIKHNERPIQCSDVKRHVVYLKSKGKWEKDSDGLQQTSNAVNRLCNKTYRNKKLWIQKHPDCNDIDTKSGVEYILLVKATSGGGQDIDVLNEQVAKKVVKQCGITK